jgi:hypothetical protein
MNRESRVQSVSNKIDEQAIKAQQQAIKLQTLAIKLSGNWLELKPVLAKDSSLLRKGVLRRLVYNIFN